MHRNEFASIWTLPSTAPFSAMATPADTGKNIPHKMTRIRSFHILLCSSILDVSQLDAHGGKDETAMVRSLHRKGHRLLLACALARRNYLDRVRWFWTLSFPVGTRAAESLPIWDARRADGGDRNVDPGVIHVRQSGLLRPGRRQDAADRVVCVIRGAPEDVGKNVMVNVDGESHGQITSSLRTCPGDLREGCSGRSTAPRRSDCR